MRSEDEEDEEQSKGYCHFNETGHEHTFTLNIFGKDIEILQKPASRDLGHGAVVWDSAVIFAKYIENDPREFSIENLHGKRLIELGSGCGLAGLSCMMRGAVVTLTDLQCVTEALTTPNADRVYRRCISEFSVAELVCPSVIPIDWTESYPSPEEPFDIVLLTDCVFSPHLAEPLVKTILSVSGRKTEVFCCHEIRDEEANKAFLDEFGKYFTIKRIPRSKLHPQYKNELVEVLKAKLKIKKK